MTKKTIGTLIKTAIVLLGIAGFICCLLMPRILDYILPGFSPYTHKVWLYALYICAAPCFAALFPAWRIAGNIADNKSFCKENAKHTKVIGILMAADTALVLITDTLLFAIGRSFLALFISFSLIIAIFLAASVCAFALSSLLDNAAVLQDQSDYTI
ncbi:MAG: DUF2975 domain-containing protein [Eubacterium sp.]|nr:DUF2975 domain-containing protein [Eubacterium sp.]